jgi:hypothetical protein
VGVDRVDDVDDRAVIGSSGERHPLAHAQARAARANAYTENLPAPAPSSNGVRFNDRRLAPRISLDGLCTVVTDRDNPPCNDGGPVVVVSNRASVRSCHGIDAINSRSSCPASTRSYGPAVTSRSHRSRAGGWLHGEPAFGVGGNPDRSSAGRDRRLLRDTCSRRTVRDSRPPTGLDVTLATL